MSHEATLDVFSDTLRVIWTGSVWQAPTTGRQFARKQDAMRDEIGEYYLACGEDVTSLEIVSEIENLILGME
jgi:hypothetical protein